VPTEETRTCKCWPVYKIEKGLDPAPMNFEQELKRLLEDVMMMSRYIFVEHLLAFRTRFPTCAAARHY
jgi:hypothetical protein